MTLFKNSRKDKPAERETDKFISLPFLERDISHELSLRHMAESSSRQIAETSSQHTAETSSRHTAEPSSQRTAETSSRYTAEPSSQRAAETSSRYTAETSSRYTAETSSQRTAETSSRYTAETSSQRTVEASSRQIAVVSPVSGTRPKPAPSDNDYGRILDLPVAEIAPNPSQPRESFDDESILRLADSIRLYGILQPLTVRLTEHPPFPCDCDITDEDISEKPRYELVAGERRLRAAKLLGFVNVPCLLVNVDARRSAELAIIENLQRENLNIFEQAGSIASLIDIYHLTQEEAARQLSMSQSFVANKLRILRLTAPEREKILKGGLTERHARALLKVDSAEQRLKIIDYILAHNLNVSTTEAYIDRFVAEAELIRRANAPRKIILKDIRLFYNSIDKAVSIVRQAGIDIDSSRTESDSETVVTIRIPKKS